MPLDISITNEEKVTVTATPVTATGRPAKLDGALVVTVAGDSTVVQDPGTPNAFTVVSADVAGDTVYTVTGDADLGAGVVPISDTVTLHVNEAQAVGLGLSASAPEPK